MFGPKLRIEYNGLGVTLVPMKKEWMENFAEMMSSLKVNMFTHGTFGFSVEDEEEWYEKCRKDTKGVQWAILPNESEAAVGVTGLHKIDMFGSCSSGIVILDPTWWGKGIASRAHLIRTWYAADILNRITIQSEVYEPNEASKRALERVGYIVTGRHLRSGFRRGTYMDALVLSWLHPDKVDMLYPEGLPSKYKEGVELAKTALERARQLVQIL